MPPVVRCRRAWYPPPAAQPAEYGVVDAAYQSVFSAILFAHGRLYAESEMTVIRAVGFSHRFIMQRPGAGLLTAAVAAFNTGWVAPQAKESGSTR